MKNYSLLILSLLWFAINPVEAASGTVYQIENVDDNTQNITSNPLGLVTGGVVGGALGGMTTNNIWGGLLGAGAGALAGGVIENQIRRPQLRKYTIRLASGQDAVVLKNPDENEQFRVNQTVYVYAANDGKLYAFSRPQR